MRTALKVVVAVVAAIGLSIGLVAPASATGGSTVKTRFTQVVVEPGLAAALPTLGVTPGVIAPGQLSSNPNSGLAVKFPITGFRNGINHDGGVTLTAGPATNISLEDFNIQLFRGRVLGTVNGTATDVPLFTIGKGQRGLGVVSLHLTDAAAGALNGTFGTEFKKGDLFGYATPFVR